MPSSVLSFFILTGNESTHTLLSRILKMAGHKENTFHDISSLLIHLENTIQSLPLAILVDKEIKNLPEVTKRIHETIRYFPIAVFGDTFSSQEMLDAMHAGAVDIFNLSALDKEALESIVERFQAAHHDAMLLYSRIHTLEAENERLEQSHILLETRTMKAEMDAEEAENTKELILANMSHELRTPLNSILGFSDLLLESNEHPQCQEYLEYIKTSGQHLLESINDLLDLSDLGSGRLVIKKHTFDLPPVLQAMGLFLNQRAAVKGVATQLDIAEDIPVTVIGDCERLKQILVELFSNAVRFTDSGTIVLRAYCTDPSLTTDAVSIAFEVSDTGVGIASEKLKTIFSCFTIAEDHLRKGRCGAGLGLAVCHDLINQMDGTIQVQSTPHEGTTFSFTLPFAIPAATPVTIPPLSILVAEDNPLNLEFLSCLLRDLGHAVHAVRDGLGVLDALQKKSYDIIMLDIQLPRLDGIATTKHIRNNTTENCNPNIPIIAVTAYNMPGDKQRFLNAGMNGYVKKPLDRYTIKRALAEVLGERLVNQ